MFQIEKFDSCFKIGFDGQAILLVETNRHPYSPPDLCLCIRRSITLLCNLHLKKLPSENRYAAAKEYFAMRHWKITELTMKLDQNELGDVVISYV